MKKFCCWAGLNLCLMKGDKDPNFQCCIVCTALPNCPRLQNRNEQNTFAKRVLISMVAWKSGYDCFIKLFILSRSKITKHFEVENHTGALCVWAKFSVCNSGNFSYQMERLFIPFRWRASFSGPNLLFHWLIKKLTQWRKKAAKWTCKFVPLDGYFRSGIGKVVCRRWSVCSRWYICECHFLFQTVVFTDLPYIQLL